MKLKDGIFIIISFDLNQGVLKLTVNNGGPPQRIFELSNSWGAFAYSVSLSLKNSVLTIKPSENQVFTRNVPGYQVLNTGENDLRFDLWDPFSWVGADGIEKLATEDIVALEVIYTTSETKESKQFGVSLGPIRMVFDKTRE